MSQQLDLLPRQGMRLLPTSGLKKPRLWIRRIVVWSEPGVVVRDVSLRPGLNIIWSPDPSDEAGPSAEAAALGHGSGKTLLCRLIRFCLGEDRYAPEGVREGIAEAFREGMVGAEIILDGVPWAVVRTIGYRRRHVAVANGDLDQVAADDTPSTGLGPILAALEQGIVTAPVAALIPGTKDGQAWLTALAWLSRDQECRFGHLLDWRAASSGSDSPVRDRDLSQADLLDGLRALLGVLTPEERGLRTIIAERDTKRGEVDQQLKHAAWDVKRRRTHLCAVLGVQESASLPGRLGLDELRRVARSALGRLGNAGVPQVNLASEREVLRAQEKAVAELEAQLREGDTELPLLKELVSKVGAELPGATFSKHSAEHPICPVCEVPIDRALAEGCGLSHRLPDLEAARARHERAHAELKEYKRKVAEVERRMSITQSQLSKASEPLAALRERIAALEQAQDSHADQWFAARRAIDDVERLAAAMDEHERLVTELDRLDKEIDSDRGRMAGMRLGQTAALDRLSRAFDSLICELAGSKARGLVKLTGRGLELNVLMGGNRSTQAINSLKVIAFDLAALMLSIEGRTYVPAFLVHDSPREADLGLSAYHRLFHLVHQLESVGSTPLFQYIITTTTRPPEELRRQPWLRETLRGAPDQERLLKKDL